MRTEKKYNSSFDLKIWKRLIPFFKPFYWIFGWTLFADLVCALTDLLMPLFQKYAVDEFIEKGTAVGIWKFAAGYGIMLVVRSLSVVMFSRGSTTIEMNLARDMRIACFKHLQTLPLSYYNVTPVGHTLSRMMSDTRRISGLIAWNLTYMLWVIPYVISVMATMAFLNFKLAVWVVLIVPFLVFLTKYFKKRILHWNREIRAQNSKITSAYNEGIMGAKTSKTLGIEEKNTKDFEKVTAEMRASGIRAAKMSAVYVSAIAMFGAVITAIILNYGGQMVLAKTLEIGTLSAFTAYAVSLFDPLQQMAGNLSELISAQANIERVMELLDEVPQITDTKEVIEKYGDVFHPKTENFEPLHGDIEFENVSFRYPDGKEDVLTEFNLKVPAGTTVAIVGETGAGKSTIVDLVCRFFEPTKGRILVDGRDYRERSQLWLHSHIGYVLQNPHLFSGSILENIRYGKLGATDEEVKAAAKCVSADQVVRHLENGWDSDVGEGGDALSTGEKQLVSFARAVLANPAIFILDEATASIDTETEQLIQGAVEYLLKDRTSFIIAHRLSTIRQADVILVVQDGDIIEQGTHEELMKRKGHYYELYTNQFRKELEKSTL